MTQTSLSLNGRIWIEAADEKILGHGRVELLERVKASGSVRQAAMQMEMSYKRAWDLIKHMNEKFGAPLVTMHRGGKGGGYAELTQKGLDTIETYNNLRAKFDEFLNANSINLLS
jgi:molybdate transport system regulatory protein